MNEAVKDSNMILSDILHNNPLWYFNHLSKEDQSYIMDHIDDVLKESEKYGIVYQAVLNDIIHSDNNHPDLAEEAFTPIRQLVRSIEIKTNTKIEKFRLSSAKTQPMVMIASDYAVMGEVINDEFEHPERTVLLVRALATYTFSKLSDIINIIDSAGAIMESDDSSPLYQVFSLISDTIDMLFSYLRLNQYSDSSHMNEVEGMVKSAMSIIDNTEGYFSGDLSSYEDKCHVSAYLMNLVMLYTLCIPTSITTEDVDFMVHKITTGYLYRRLKSTYYRDRDELEQMLKDNVELSLFSNSGNLHAHELAKKYTTFLNKSLEIIGSPEIQPNDTTEIKSNDLSISQQVEVDQLKRIKESDIADALCTKLGVNKDAVKVSPFGNVEEELLAMYLAEFNSEHPLVIFPGDDHYYIRWDGMFYILFELETKLGDVKNCLYAIRIVNDDLSKKYDIIQFKKCDSVNYVFEY